MSHARSIGAGVLTAGIVYLIYVWLRTEDDHTTVVESISIKTSLPGWNVFIQNDHGPIRSRPRVTSASSTIDLVCQVPQLDLAHDANIKYYPELKPLVCNGSRLFYMNESILRINYTAMGGRELEYCVYRAINRISDMEYSYSKPINRTANFEVRIDNDFFLVECYFKGNKLGDVMTKEASYLNDVSSDAARDRHAKYSNITFNTRDNCKRGTSIGHWLMISSPPSPYSVPEPAPDVQQLVAQIHVKEDVLERISKIKAPSGSTQMNVLILGLDSMSHMAYQRVMPLTYRYLKETLGAVMLNSYNIVGDGTLAAFIPLLTGNTELELPDTRLGTVGSLFTKYADVYPLIWKAFQKSGYVTMYGEDYPLIETFQMRMQGFKLCPVDHYMRAFWQAAYEADAQLRRDGSSHCLGGHGRHVAMLDYVKDFFVKYPGAPKFALQFLVGFSHSHPNLARYADADVRDLLDFLHTHGHLDNTLLVAMSDHGPRFGEMRLSAQGKVEERLPMMALAFPKSFKAKYPHLMANLVQNADRLSTPFDLHKTLESVLDIRKLAAPVESTARGISLLQEIPANRTCADAGVDIHWCTCMEFETLDTNDSSVHRLADVLVSHLNQRTEAIRDKCNLLQLKNILDVKLVHSNKQMLKFIGDAGFHLRESHFVSSVQTDMIHYQVTIETSPNAGMYEATIRGYVADGSLQVVGEVSRINKYGEQPKCIIEQYPNLRKYCHCKS